MLNCFYWYSILWGVILFLYSLKLSDFSMQLSTHLLIFIVITSCISWFLGYIFKDDFKIKTQNIIIRHRLLQQKEKISLLPAYIVTVLYFMNFLYAGSIPFLGYITGLFTYGDDIRSIPHVSVVMVILALFYSVKYFYLFCITINKRYLMGFIIIFSNIVLKFSRSQMMLVMIAISLIVLQIFLERGKLLNRKNIIIAIVVFLSAAYLFGVIGNIREGYGWNDNSFIDLLGRYTKYPSFIPGQYKWLYSYAISPLSNLNYNIVNHNSNFNIRYFLVQFLPESLTNRFVYGYKNNMNAMLVKNYFTVSTGYCDSYVYGGILGMYLFFGYFVVNSLLFIVLNRKRKENTDRAVCLSFLNLIWIINFFQNTFWYTETSLTLILCYIILIKQYIRIKSNALYMDRFFA